MLSFYKLYYETDINKLGGRVFWVCVKPPNVFAERFLAIVCIEVCTGVYMF